LPFVWLVLSALKPVDQFYAAPPTLLPAPPTLDNILRALSLVETPRLIAQSLFVAGASAVGAVFSSAVVGYGFATMRARGRDALFAVVIATLLVPPAATIVPQFILFSRLGWVDTYLPLIVPHLFGSAFYIFLFRQWFRSLPAHVFENAEIDGATPLQAFRHIALPLSVPAMAAVAVFAFVGSWNDFLAPLVYLRSPDSFTLSVGMATLQGVYVSQLHLSVAISVVALIPPIAVFLVAQRFLSGGVANVGWRA
ncbi:MAG: carbohydrate ABC transporter permease, partial [Candidatus Limnocylindrales bacterium]